MRKYQVFDFNMHGCSYRYNNRSYYWDGMRLL